MDGCSVEGGHWEATPSTQYLYCHMCSLQTTIYQKERGNQDARRSHICQFSGTCRYLLCPSEIYLKCKVLATKCTEFPFYGNVIEHIKMFNAVSKAIGKLQASKPKGIMCVGQSRRPKPIRGRQLRVRADSDDEIVPIISGRYVDSRNC